MARLKYRVIAARSYGVEGEPDREIIVKIGEPIRPGTPTGDWTCPVLLEGLEPEVEYVEGIDAIQAIQGAMRYARYKLDASGLAITWMDQEPGDIGLPLPINSPFGLWLQRRLEQLVEDEIGRVGEIVQQLIKSRARRGRGP